MFKLVLKRKWDRTKKEGNLLYTQESNANNFQFESHTQINLIKWAHFPALPLELFFSLKSCYFTCCGGLFYILAYSVTHAFFRALYRNTFPRVEFKKSLS